jgi:hypothetical protein
VRVVSPVSRFAFAWKLEQGRLRNHSHAFLQGLESALQAALGPRSHPVLLSTLELLIAGPAKPGLRTPELNYELYLICGLESQNPGSNFP